MNDILPFVSKIMNLDTSSDSIEAVRLITSMVKSGLQVAKQYLPKLFTLIYIRDQTMKKEV